MIDLLKFHEPYVCCIARGKAHKKYAFGCKVSVTITSQVLLKCIGKIEFYSPEIIGVLRQA